MDKLENTKDKAVGKAVEAAGKLTKDQELEFTGKIRQMTTEVKDKFHSVKEDVFQEANNMIDRSKGKTQSMEKNQSEEQNQSMGNKSSTEKNQPNERSDGRL